MNINFTYSNFRHTISLARGRIGDYSNEMNRYLNGIDYFLGIFRSLKGYVDWSDKLPEELAYIKPYFPDRIVRLVASKGLPILSAIKTISPQVTELRNTLSFLELLKRVAKVRDEEWKHLALVKKVGSIFQIAQKFIESSLILPSKWKWYEVNLPTVVVQYKFWKKKDIEVLEIVKDIFSIAASGCNLWFFFQETRRGSTSGRYQLRSDGLNNILHSLENEEALRNAVTLYNNAESAKARKPHHKFVGTLQKELQKLGNEINAARGRAETLANVADLEAQYEKIKCQVIRKWFWESYSAGLRIEDVFLTPLFRELPTSVQEEAHLIARRFDTPQKRIEKIAAYKLAKGLVHQTNASNKKKQNFVGCLFDASKFTLSGLNWLVDKKKTNFISHIKWINEFVTATLGIMRTHYAVKYEKPLKHPLGLTIWN